MSFADDGDASGESERLKRFAWRLRASASIRLPILLLALVVLTPLSLEVVFLLVSACSAVCCLELSLSLPDLDGRLELDRVETEGASSCWSL